MNEYLLYVSFAAAVGFLFYAIMTRKQLLDHKAIAKEASSQLERAQKKLQKFDGQGNQHQKSIQQVRDQLGSAEKKLNEAQKKLQQKDQELEADKLQLKDTLEKEARKRDHLEQQNQALTSQLAEVVKEKQAAQNELKQLDQKSVSSEEMKSLKDELEKSKKVLSDLRKENKTWKNEVEKARQILSKVKPGELKRLKVKASRMEQLYTSMKGLREMAEERNENWETALRMLAAHISGKELKDDLATGPLLGEALEKIGANLVIDEHTNPEDSEQELSSTVSSPSPSVEATETV